MGTVVVCASPDTQSDAALERQFRALAERWRSETLYLSSTTKIVMNRAYQRIIGMGPRVLPLIFRELAREPDHWFWALSVITGDDPVPPADVGDIRKMTEVWLDYGHRHGYLP